MPLRLLPLLALLLLVRPAAAQDAPPHTDILLLDLKPRAAGNP